MILSAAGACFARADSVVVFNEIAYHPAAPDEAALEWIELHNQRSVDVDLSRWRLEGAVRFAFPEGTVIPGGAFLVVGASPGTLAAMGVTNVLGPFTGRLGNGGDTLQLRNNNDRLLDTVSYGTEGEWPVAPDGAGPSLAKRAANLASADPANWQASARLGGTPGADNFPVTPPPVRSTTLIALDAAWRVHDQGTDPGLGWLDPTFDDSGWPTGPGLFYRTPADLPAPKRTLLAAGPTTYYFRTPFVFHGQAGRVGLKLRPLLDDGAVVYLNGVEVQRLNMPSGLITPSTLASAAVGDAVLGGAIDLPVERLLPGTNRLAVEVHQASALTGYPEAVLKASPVGYWRLGETASPAVDLATAAGAPQAGAQNGTFQNVSASQLGQPGPGPADAVNDSPLLGFGAANASPRFAGNRDGGDDVVLIPDPGVLDFSAGRQFTLAAWVNGPAAQESGAAILAKGTGGGGEQYCVDVYSEGYRFFVRDGGAGAVVAQSSVGPNGTWQHVVAVVDEAARRMELFVNGSPVASANPPATLLESTHDVSLGARKNTGSTSYDLNFDGRLDEVALFNRALTRNEIVAQFAAAFDRGSGSGPDTIDVVFGLELVATETLPVGETGLLVFNELAPATDPDFWLELHNPGPLEAELGGCVIARRGGATRREYTLPPQTLAPGALRTVTRGELGFGADPGDRLALYTPNRDRVLDAVVARRESRGRHPDGRGGWWFPTQPTPGASNHFVLHDELVINEIMFHPPDPPGSPTRSSPGSWIEIFNRSTNSVPLAGWRLDAGIDFRFPSDTVLAPGGYVVVAQDAAYLKSLHPTLDVVGPFIRKLSRSGDYVALKDPANNLADEVRYFDAGRWPGYADGGGSSLELRDPRADNTVAEAWAASDESGKSSWQTFTWRGLARPGQAGEPTRWHEFAMCLLDGAGEVWLDDLSVVERPATTPRQLIPNGSFHGGSAAHWRFLGTHRHSRVETEPGQPGNHVLRLVATGSGEYQGNQIETTLANNAAIADGVEYEISFRARWLAGKSLLNSRLYFNRLARSVRLATPALHGTPGAANSRLATNLGPTLQNLAHAPVIPNAAEPVTVSVEASDPDGVAAMSLKYAVNGGAWQAVPMSVRPPRITDQVPGLTASADATIPGQPAAAIIQFYVETTDALGAMSRLPAGGADSRALYGVQDGQAIGGALRHFRVLMTPGDAAFLHTGTNTLSNELLGCTVVVDEREVFYEAGVRLKGSFVGRNVARVGYHVQFPPDHLYLGVHETVSVDRSQHVLTGGVGEIIVKHLAGHAGGIPHMHDDLARLIAPLPSRTGMSALRLGGFDEQYLDSQFPDGSDGPMFELEVLRWNLATVDGHPESPKQVGNESGGTGYANLELQDYGEDPEHYRWLFLLVNNRSADDYAPAIALAKTFGLTGTRFETDSSQLLDVDQWLRVLAFQSLIGPADAYYTGANIHNFRLFVRPADRKALYFPWDWDSCFMAGASASLYGSGNVAKLLGTPARNRAYLNHLDDLIATTFNPSYAARWTAHYGAMSGQDFSGVLGYIGQRASHVRGRLPTATPFAITSHGGNGFAVTNGQVVLTGTAPIAVHRLQVNGSVHPVTWTTTTNWSAILPLDAGINPLVVRGLNQQGDQVANSTAAIVVTNTGPGALRPVVINEWMADNAAPGGWTDAADGLCQDWFELFNPNPTTVSLSGLFLTDDLDAPTQWRIPPEVFLSGGGFLVVWADGDVSQNPASGGTNVDLHADFQLNRAGESVALFARDGVTPLSIVAFGPQAQNVSQGRFPDGDSASLYSMERWTPGTANTLAGLSPPRVLSLTRSDQAAALLCEVMPGRTYHLEFTPALAETAWMPASLGPAQRATGSTLTFTDPLDPWATTRFYRVLLLP